ncbi:MAG: 5-formyltetrahydrofolate cyclo-ligase [Piscinibacter sp.]|nr:5-formyltetrahydrofolate cyclo-ligase [Piscinibacter sp.]
MSAAPPASRRQALRLQLRAERERFAAGATFAAAHEALAARLAAVLARLEPQCLGLYAAIRSEFNAAVALRDDAMTIGLPWALPFTRREPREMHYRRWDRTPATLLDECGIPACEGAPVVPDVVLVPCVGFTREGYRLGYGGGYFDRYLAAHPHVTAVGVAWSGAEIAADEFDVQPHDRPLMLVVTEQAVFGG